MIKLITAIILIASICIAKDIYVSKNGSHIPPYGSWITAATNINAIQGALANGDNIYIADGEYVLTNILYLTNNTLQGVSVPTNVNLKWGFGHTITNIIKATSGSKIRNISIQNNYVLGYYQSSINNSFIYLGANCSLSNVYILNNSNYYSMPLVHVAAGGASIDNCKFINNVATNSSINTCSFINFVQLSDTNPVYFRNSEMRFNRNVWSAMVLPYGVNTIISNSIFSDNVSGSRGGIWLAAQAVPQNVYVYNSLFISNAVSATVGSDICGESMSAPRYLYVYNCKFRGLPTTKFNVPYSNGRIYITSGNIYFDRCEFAHGFSYDRSCVNIISPTSLAIKNSIFHSSQNYVSSYSKHGGGLLLVNTYNNPAYIYNCTFAHNISLNANYGLRAGGMYAEGNVDVVNCIFYSNALHTVNNFTTNIYINGGRIYNSIYQSIYIDNTNNIFNCKTNNPYLGWASGFGKYATDNFNPTPVYYSIAINSGATNINAGDKDYYGNTRTNQIGTDIGAVETDYINRIYFFLITGVKGKIERY